MSAYASFPKTALQLYRDCLRLVKHIAPGHSAKAIALRTTVRSQFEAQRRLTDPDQIAAHKANAVRALSNYVLLSSAPKDTKLKTAMNTYHDKSVQEANKDTTFATRNNSDNDDESVSSNQDISSSRGKEGMSK